MKIKGRDKQESLSGLRHFKKIGEIIWYSNGSSLSFGLILIRGEMCGCRFPAYCGVTGELSQMARLPLNPTMMKSRQEWQIIRLVQSVELLRLTFHR